MEGLYAALPLFLYFNSSMVKPLLVPLLEQQNSSSYSASYAASDIGKPSAAFVPSEVPLIVSVGASYPIASGATAAESDGVERECFFMETPSQSSWVHRVGEYAHHGFGPRYTVGRFLVGKVICEDSASRMTSIFDECV